MSLDLHLEIMEVMLEHIPDHKDALEDFVAKLVEHGYDAEEIAAATTNEEIKKVCTDYSDEVEVDEEEDEYEEEYDWDD